jgi:CheY-like chemotaxis protein
MITRSRDPQAPKEGNPGCPGGTTRLNLRLSYAGWQPDPWVERLPRLLEPMGIASHLAQTGKEASDLIKTTPIHVAVVDLGLPLDEREGPDSDEFTEGGPRLLELLQRLEVPPPVVAIKRTRTHRDDSRDINAALRMGAFAILDRPQTTADLNLVLDVLRRCLERHYHGKWPGSS